MPEVISPIYRASKLIEIDCNDFFDPIIPGLGESQREAQRSNLRWARLYARRVEGGKHDFYYDADLHPGHLRDQMRLNGCSEAFIQAVTFPFCALKADAVFLRYTR